VGQDPILRPLFPGKTFTCAIKEFAAFLVQFLDGPREDTQSRWWLSLQESHLRFKIGRKERAAWMKNMIQALDDVSIMEPARGALLGLFERSSAYVVNQELLPSSAKAASGDRLYEEMACRWETQLRLDEIVAAIRKKDADRAIALTEDSASPTSNRPIFAGLLALMLGNGQSALLEYVREKLVRDPALGQEQYAGRSLLHEASARGNLGMVELLLRLGANPNEEGRHRPLYCVANQCRWSGGAAVVRVLVQAGAQVNFPDGVQQCTALHLAARRGNVEVAQALLDVGADIEARDKLGDTPLRRAVNCNKLEVACLLLFRGADRHSRGSKGLTPLQAARSDAMKQLLR
jgi:truncated hemoglobin YjbI